MSLLREYQQRALEALRACLRRGLQRVILYSPTGSGKTEIALAMARAAAERRRRTLFVVNRVELVGQAFRRAVASGLEAGILQGENSRSLGAPLICASIQTIIKRGCPLDIELIIIDEAHATAGSKAYGELMRRTNAVPTIGLTATPFTRGLGRNQEDSRPLWEEMIVAATIGDLVGLGYLVDVEIYAPTEPNLSGVKLVAGDYHETQLGEAVDRPQLVGDIVTHWKRLAGGARTVCFATNIAHSRHIVEQFNATGVTAEHIDCHTANDDRRSILQRLDSGETRVVSNVAVLAEGWDCPAVEIMVLARPTRSLVRYIQMAGRILRPAIGKENALILDHSGTCRRLGFPTDDLPLRLDQGKPTETGKRRQDERLPEVCTGCAYLKPVGVHACPSCGFAPERKSEVEHRSGVLERLERRGDIGIGEKQEIYSALLTIQRKRGYQYGWVAHNYRDITGVWPRGLAELEGEVPKIVTNHLLRRRIAYAKAKQKAASTEVTA